MKAVRSGSQQQLKDEILLSKYQILFTSPEVLLQDKDWTDIFKNRLFANHLVGIIIDKAHCVKKCWVSIKLGHRGKTFLYKSSRRKLLVIRRITDANFVLLKRNLHFYAWPVRPNL